MIKSEKPCHLSEYNVKFKRHENQQRRAMIRPPIKSAARDAKMESETTSGRDFVSHPVTPPAKKTPVVYQPPEERMNTSTEYKNTFLGKWQAPLHPILPARRQKDSDEPFSHTTTHANDYLAPPITPRKFYRSQSIYEPPTNRFDGSSTSHSDFVDYGAVPITPKLKPPETDRTSTQPLDGVTSYRSNFTTPDMPQKFQKPKEVYVPSSEEFSCSTTSRSAFPKHPVIKIPETKKLAQKRDNSNIPFESSTTNRQTYKIWDLPKKISRPPTTYTRPTEKVSNLTTSKVDYQEYGCVTLATSCKPQQRANDQIAPFESRSTQNSDYKAWTDVKRTQPIRQDQQYEPPKEKLDTTTTFKMYYKGEYEPRALSTKPPLEPYAKSSEMDFKTSYSQSFSGPGYKSCPSIPLMANNTSKFDYSHEDSSGHKFYVPKVNQ